MPVPYWPLIISCASIVAFWMVVVPMAVASLPCVKISVPEIMALFIRFIVPVPFSPLVISKVLSEALSILIVPLPDRAFPCTKIAFWFALESRVFLIFAWFVRLIMPVPWSPFMIDLVSNKEFWPERLRVPWLFGL